MDKVNRRKFIRNFLIGNTSLILGANLLVNCTDVFSGEFTDQKKGAIIGKKLKYLPIQNENPAIVRWPDKCEKCEKCVETCAEQQKVFGTYQASETKHVCIHCGSCILKCEENAMTEKYHWQDVLNAIDNPSKIVIASISPAVRVGIGDYFDIAQGSFLEKNLVGSCRTLGFDYVLDTNFSADLTIIEEAAELQKRLREKFDLPQFTSCCPAWVKYVEIYYPSLLKHLSTVRSPISMQGSMIKSYFAQKNGIDPVNIIHVAIAPCTAKKYEITRDEITTNGLRSTDIVITTNELAKMMKKRKVNLKSQSGNFDSFMGAASGGGIIFGNTGGVTRAALRTAYFNITGTNPPANLMELKQIQGLSGLKEAKVTIGTTTLNIAVCYEMRNAVILLDQVNSGTCKYDFIEVMACKGGCVGGAGQPASSGNIEKRIKALNTADTQAVTRFSHENPQVKAIYKDFLGEVGGSNAKTYLHTSYNSKANLL
jgi:NADH-quinone oxidoreductase subunit G